MKLSSMEPGVYHTEEYNVALVLGDYRRWVHDGRPGEGIFKGKLHLGNKQFALPLELAL